MICNFASAQTPDTTLARVDTKNTDLEEGKSISRTKPTTNRSEETAPSTSFKLPNQRSTLDSKVGPNGEDLIQKKNRYFYINNSGKKIRVRQSELKDRPKSS